MTEKRFEPYDEDRGQCIWDSEKGDWLSEKEVCKYLNTLYKENKWLKNENSRLRSELYVSESCNCFKSQDEHLKWRFKNE